MKRTILLFISLISYGIISAQWEEVNLGTDANFQDVCVSLTNDDHIFVAGEDKIFKSTDGGKTWSESVQVYTTTIWGITFPTEDIGFVCSTDGRILSTTDGGATWNENFQIGSGGFDRIVFKDALNGIASGTSIYTTFDGGSTWNLEQNEGYWALDHGNGDTYFACSVTKIVKSLDNGGSWITLEQNFAAMYGSVSFYDNDHGLVGDAGQVWFTENGGSTFTSSASPGFGINRAAARMDSDTSYISGEDGVIYKTTNKGESWAIDGDFSGEYFRDMTINNSNTKVFACGFDGALVMKSYTPPEPDPAISVEPAALNFDSIPVNDTVSLLLTVTNSGGHTLIIDSITSDNEYFWTNQGTFSLTANESLSFDVYYSPTESGQHNGILALYNNTVFTSKKNVPMEGYGFESVGIQEKETFEGVIVYPNPATSNITIRFEENQDSQINLEIVNLLGSRVYEASFNANMKSLSIDVSKMERGLYILTLDNGKDQKQSKVLIK